MLFWDSYWVYCLYIKDREDNKGNRFTKGISNCKHIPRDICVRFLYVVGFSVWLTRSKLSFTRRKYLCTAKSELWFVAIFLLEDNQPWVKKYLSNAIWHKLNNTCWERGLMLMRRPYELNAESPSIYYLPAKACARKLYRSTGPIKVAEGPKQRLSELKRPSWIMTTRIRIPQTRPSE